MSKAFEQARSVVPGNGSSAVAVDQVLAKIQDLHSVAAQVAEVRSHNFKKLPLTCGSPLLVTANEEHTTMLAEAYRALRTRVLRQQGTKGFRSVVLSSATPGEGKSLTSANLGLSCAQLPHFPVLVVDADMRTHGLSTLLGCPAERGLSDVLAGSCSPESAVVATSIPNFYVLPAGENSASPPELLAESRWPDLVAWAAEAFRLAIIDAPPVLPLADFELITAAADAVLVVVRALYSPRVLLQEAVSKIDSGKILGLVLNDTDESLAGHYSYYYAGSKYLGKLK